MNYLLTIQSQHKVNGDTRIYNKVISYNPTIWLADNLAESNHHVLVIISCTPLETVPDFAIEDITNSKWQIKLPNIAYSMNT